MYTERRWGHKNFSIIYSSLSLALEIDLSEPPGETFTTKYFNFHERTLQSVVMRSKPHCWAGAQFGIFNKFIFKINYEHNFNNENIRKHGRVGARSDVDVGNSAKSVWIRSTI